MNAIKTDYLARQHNNAPTYPLQPRGLTSIKLNWGYTLVELMIVITILSLMLAAAVPAYSSFTRSSREMQATTQIQKIALKLQQRYNETMSYQTDLPALDMPVRDSWYQYRVDSPDRKQYTIFAVPLVANNARKEFTLDQHGLRRHRQTGSSNWVSGWSSS